MFHEVRATVSRAIMSSSFVGTTRHKRPDSVVMRPLLFLPFSSLSFESITGFRIARCVSTSARIDALFSPMPPVKMSASIEASAAVRPRSAPDGNRTMQLRVAPASFPGSQPQSRNACRGSRPIPREGRSFS